ncbi:MAG: hypothetical protein NTY38_32350 [Acidobacteria bacterium]|nr:hypothetical protein [Acidobacteriota bacterium]
MQRGELAWLVYVTRPARRPTKAIRWLSYHDIRLILELILESLKPTPSAAMVIEHFCEHIMSDLET